MGKREEWEKIRRLGDGGQSEVFLVRRPERSSKRRESLEMIRTAIDGDKRQERSVAIDQSRSSAYSASGVDIASGSPLLVMAMAARRGAAQREEEGAALANAIWTYARPDTDSELGAFKAFKVPESREPAAPDGTEGDEAVRRLSNEIDALKKGRPGLPKLLDSNLEEHWLVTEFFAEGTLERKPEKYKGDALRALKAYQSLVKTVASLHQENNVHRDIKPANVFISRDGNLILGDFGIVFVPNEAERVTLTNERVGPRDYMPPWGDLGERLNEVHPNFDVYMLGKLLWCMVSGRQKLPRESQRRKGFDLTEAFPNDPAMEMINSILDCSVVEDESKCLPSAGDLLKIVDHYLSILERGGQLISDSIRRSCRTCGVGNYVADAAHVSSLRLSDLLSRPAGAIFTEYFVCDACGHVELFRTKKRIPY